MKKLFKYALPAFAIFALAACSDDITEGIKVTPEGDRMQEGKYLIDFAGDGSGITRALLTRAGFTGTTTVMMRIKAEEDGGTGVRFAESTATATANITSDSHSALVGEHSDLNYVAGKELYWDDAFGRKSKLTVWAFAIPNKVNPTLPTWSKNDWAQVDANTNPNWYTDSGNDDVEVAWNVSLAQTAETMGNEDLAYSNNISATGKGGRYHYTYNEASTATSKWEISTMSDGQMIWQPKSNATGETTGKFDQGHLIFKHALAKIEINLIEGDGFSTTLDDFGWTKNKASATQNITLKNLHTNGTFDVSTGAWKNTWPAANSEPITQMVESTPTIEAGKTTRKLQAYVLPDNNLANEVQNVIEFEIDNAQYYVTGQQIAAAIKSYYTTGAGKNDPKADEYKNFETTQQGKHYIINLKVGKKGIDRITAAIVNWEEVNSDEITPKNTYPTFTFDNRGTKLEDGDANEFRILRAAQTAGDYITGNAQTNYEWATGYNTDDAATKTWNNTDKEWSTAWFWPDNLTYYHFRTVGIDNGDATSDPTVVTNATTGDNFVIHSGALTGPTYKDYTWGAPFMDKDGANLTYSTETGFDNQVGTGNTATHQISYAIGATESVIRMLLFHMTSQIYVNVTTSKGTDKVVLHEDAAGSDPEKHTKVEILNFLPDGTVLVGNGLVQATDGTRTTAAEMTTGTFTAEGVNAAKYENFSYGIVPQLLTGTGFTVGLRITTPDGNQYLITDISTLTASVTSNNLTNPYTEAGAGTGKYTINRWYPNYKYTYNITVTKKGIDRITAAVVDWETVTGDNINIDLEN